MAMIAKEGVQPPTCIWVVIQMCSQLRYNGGRCNVNTENELASSPCTHADISRQISMEQTRVNVG